MGENLPDGWHPILTLMKCRKKLFCFSLEYQSRDLFWEIPSLLFPPYPSFLHGDIILPITQNCIVSFLKTRKLIFSSSLCLYFGIE